MGGCRCYFRECHVSSQKFPGMHFFRFPLKEAERYRKWRQYSKMDQMLKFSEVRRKNTSICARHFRPECFMNYKMDRLTPTAVPTIMRLSDDKALDFELDIENGGLVNLEQPKLKHLLPPEGFECPLFLANDKILLDKLNELQSQQYDINEHIDFMDLDQGECEEFLENPPKPLPNSVEILETIQVVAPSLKRPRQNLNEEKVTTARDKKCRILNTSNFPGGNDVKKISTIVLTTMDDEFESEELKFVETIQIENSNELTSNDSQLFSTNETFINDNCDEDLEIFQIHKTEKNSQIELPVNDVDATIVQIKSPNDSNIEAENLEIINIQKQLEFDQIKQDFDTVCVKYSLLKTENKELKKNCQEIEEMKRNQLLLQVENNDLKKCVKDFNSMKEKLRKYSEENRLLLNETTNIQTLKSELLSRKEETKELKKLLETLRSKDSKNPNIELEIKNKEVNGLRKKLELLKQKFNDTSGELKEVQTNFKNIENENVKLTEHKNILETSLKNMENSFDLKQNDYIALKSNFEDLKLKQSALEQKYWKLVALQNQEATVSTSLERGKTDAGMASAPSISATALTKAQLFNGIKRYLCSSMVSLLRMEMFGNTEREWKADERQVAVDILRLGEVAYKYFTDEWRIRLPALRDARDWLSQSQQIMEDEEDL